MYIQKMNSLKTLLYKYILNMSNIHNIRQSHFGLCTGYLDERTGLFIEFNQSSKDVCCLNTCKPLINKCVELCKNSEDKDCYDLCDNIRTSCKHNCDFTSKYVNTVDPIYMGTLKYGCGDNIYKTIDSECVTKNKEKIIDICESHCLPTSQMDCTENCKYSFDLITNKQKDPLYFAYEKSDDIVKSGDMVGEKVTIHVSIILVMILIFCIVVIYKYIKK
jgi:hypothetical protein